MYLFQEEISSCTQCGECQNACPVSRVTGDGRFTPQGKIASLEKIIAGIPLTQDQIDNIYLSTRCGACDDACPMGIPITRIIQYERELLAQQGKEPAKTTAISKNILVRNSPGSMDPKTRFDWVTDDLKIAESSEIAYMAGCWVAHSQPDIARATIRLLNHGGIVPMLIKDEKCCGLFLIDNGHMEEAAQHAKRFSEHIESLGIKQVVASCPGCYLVLKHEYPKLFRELGFSVEHSLNIFRNMIQDGRIRPGKLSHTVSVRDACPMWKTRDVSRDILLSTGVEIKELFDGQQTCCGGPAGLKPNFPDIAADIAMLSVRDYKERADLLVSYCPFCMHHIKGVCNSKNEDLNMKDIAVLLAESVFGPGTQ